MVIAGFSGFFARRGTSPGDLAPQESGADPREPVVLTLWLPMPFALAILPALRRLSKQSLPRSG